MKDILCRIGFHDFSWPPHDSPYSLWEEYWIECHRGCGARTVKKCFPDEHWVDRHPEPPEGQ